MLVSLRNLLCIKRPVSNSSHIRLLECQTGIRDNADNAGWLQGDGRFPRCRMLDGDLVNHHGSCSGRTAMCASRARRNRRLVTEPFVARPDPL